jgi:hypothetical protein
MANSKEKMLEAVREMESIVDRYYGQNLQRELASLREALEEEDDVKLDEAIRESIDGCMTATSDLRRLGYALDNFEQAQHEIQSEIDAAVEAFENAE